MNDTNNKSSVIFTPSGCLTADALLLFVSGALKGIELTKANQHIAECPLCTDAADGLRLWLKENKPEQSDQNRPAGLSGDKAAKKGHSNGSPASAAYKFHNRTEAINDRIKQRIHFHKQVEAVKHKRRIIRPYAWIGAAATVVLFLSIFYVFRIQKLSDLSNLAKQNEAFESIDMVMPDSTKQLPDTKTKSD